MKDMDFRRECVCNFCIGGNGGDYDKNKLYICIKFIKDYVIIYEYIYINFIIYVFFYLCWNNDDWFYFV